nr:MAG TPA: hypothetical protein [Caudoviricetes sp.]
MGREAEPSLYRPSSAAGAAPSPRGRLGESGRRIKR